MGNGNGDLDDERYFLHGGRRWRREDPQLPGDVRERLLSHLGRARAEVMRQKKEGDDVALAEARGRVQKAKEGLGERGEAWWEQSQETRRRRWDAALAALEGDGDTP